MIGNLSVTTLLLIVIGGASLYAWNRQDIMQKWIFNPYSVAQYRQWWRFFTSTLIHADYMHLGFNLYAFYLFGKAIEQGFADPDVFGAAAPLYLIAVFVLGALVADIPTYFQNKDNPGYNSLGASGGVSSVVFAYIIMFPTRELGIILIPGLSFKAIWFGLGYLAFSYFAARRGMGRVNHSAHFWGGIFGVVFMAIMYPESITNLIRTIKELLG